MTTHAKFSPSAAHRWMPCPGSIYLCKDIPNTSSDFADEGTAAHELAAMALQAGNDCHAYKGRRIEVKTGYGAQQKRKYFEVDDDMVDYVQAYVGFVRDRAIGKTLMIETKVDFSSYVGVPGQFGTSDAVIIDENAGVIELHDLKYGRGVRVDAANNEQLQLYALGALNQFDMVCAFQTVRMFIHQPRMDHIDEWEITVDELKAFAKRAEKSVSLAMAPFHDERCDPSLILHPGDKQCRFCPAKGVCPAVRAEVSKSVFDDFDDVVSDAPVKLVQPTTDEALSRAYSKIDLIEGWCKAIATQMHTELMSGKQMPGYKMVEGKRGNRAWLDKDDAERTLKSMRLKTEEMYSMTLISPTQAEKVVKKSSPKRWMKLLRMITQADGQPHIAPIDDKRPALIIKPILDDFDDIGGDLV